MDINVVVLTGNVTADSKLLKIGEGKHALNFAVACNMGTKLNGEKDTTYFDCVMYDNYAKAMEPHIKRGRGLTLQGTQKENHYINADGKKVTHKYVVVGSLKLAPKKEVTDEKSNSDA